MPSARRALSSCEGTFWSLQPAFWCALIYLFGSNFVAPNVIISVKHIEVAAEMSECSGQEAAEDLHVQPPRWGELTLLRWF